MIGIVSPHLYSAEGTMSPNLGDEIIYNYLSKELKSIFVDQQFYAFPLHDSLNRYHKELLKRLDFIFITGSNFLTPSFGKQRKAIASIFDFGIRNKIVFMGAGWSGSENSIMDKETLNCYQTIMHKRYAHSVRDSLSLGKLAPLKLPILNTACPTMWALNSKEYKRFGSSEDCLFTLTDYSIDIEADERFLNLIIERFFKLYFFPQGRFDIEYLMSLDVYKSNQDRFIFLDRSIASLNEFLRSNKPAYIGTRLHCGIHALNYGIDSLILEVDNRAKYIAKDTGLPVCVRGDMVSITKWMDGKNLFKTFTLPKTLNLWKESFKK